MKAIIAALKNHPVRCGAACGPILVWVQAMEWIGPQTAMMLASVLTAFTGLSVTKAVRRKTKPPNLTL